MPRTKLTDQATSTTAKKARKSSGRSSSQSQAEVVAKEAPAGWRQRISGLLRSGRFQKIFAWTSFGVLMLTSVFWAVLGARLHENNADQFIDAYLFDDASTFTNALFPGAHTFLIKWPVFLLMQLYGYHTFVFMAATVLMVLPTVALLAYLIRKIDPRPVVFGVVCLALSLVLLLVPAQPYPGALLPANFAMTTTRNLEYALFVWCLYRFVSARPHIRQWTFWLLAGLMALVIASDKLFAVLLLGGAAAALVGYAGVLRRRYELRTILRLGVLGIMAFALANVLLLVLSRTGLTNIVNEGSTSPYPLVHSAGQLAQGLLYAAGALLTNMGANPIHDNLVVRDIPAALLQSIMRPSFIAYFANFLVAVAGLYAIVRVILSRTSDAPTRLTVLLCGSTLAALAVFALTDHYYPVDARYVAIELFAVFIALATYTRGRQLRGRAIMALSGLLVLLLPIGMAQAWHEYQLGSNATAADTSRTVTIAKILDRNHISRLLGDYWKITPVKSRTATNITVAPVDDCQTPHPVLNSKAWFTMPKSTPSALLLQRDGTDEATFNGCSLARIATLYGAPTDRVVLDSNPQPPYLAQTMLLLYGNGTEPLSEQKAADTPKPLAAPVVAALRETGNCTETSLNVVAHQDDDLLFMNPDILGDIAAGRCIRTVYVTAGDAGAGRAYWQSRDMGARAAYADMYNVPSVWHEERQQLNGRFVTVATLEGRPNVSLVFLHLPDGNPEGSGFAVSNHENLAALTSGAIHEMHNVEDGSSYTKDQLVSDLKTIMDVDAPTVIRSQGSDNAFDGDHSDHHAVGQLTELARQEYNNGPQVVRYIGYPNKVWPVNLTDDQVTLKERAFLAYAKFDGAVCQSAFDCQQTYTYGNYLIRQYSSQP